MNKASIAEAPVAAPAPHEWYEDRAELLVVVDWLAKDRSASVREIAHLLEKPWKFTAEYQTAKAVLDHERATEHMVFSQPGSDVQVYCNEVDTCGWTFDGEQASA